MPRSLHALAAVAVLILAVSCATTRCGPSQPEAGRALLDFEHRWIDALLHKDVRALDGLLADDFLDNAYNGNVYAKKAGAGTVHRRLPPRGLRVAGGERAGDGDPSSAALRA